MTEVSRTIDIHVPADAIRHVNSDFGAGGHYLAGVTDGTIEGAGVGTQRTLTYVDDSTIVERLEVLDEIGKCLSIA